jgi:ribosome-associated translation inhibitor RaiA
VQFQLRGRGIRVTEQLAEHVEQRLKTAFGRLGDRVREVRVQLTDENGPRGGEDIHCRIQASLEPRGTLIVDQRADDPFVAVAAAAERTAHTMRRQVGRLRRRR